MFVHPLDVITGITHKPQPFNLNAQTIRLLFITPLIKTASNQMLFFVVYNMLCK